MLRVRRFIPRPVPPLGDGLLPGGPPVFLDIETTGLSRHVHHLTLVGLVIPAPGGRILEQFFAERPDDERGLLADLAAFMELVGQIVTFNGRRFDIPFLTARCCRHGLDWQAAAHLDLLPVAREWNARHHVLPNCRLQTLMRHFHLGRTDATSGAEMVAAYRRWLRTHNPAERDLILTHNAEDILLMPELAEQLSRSVAGRSPDSDANAASWRR